MFLHLYSLNSQGFIQKIAYEGAITTILTLRGGQLKIASYSQCNQLIQYFKPKGGTKYLRGELPLSPPQMKP